MLICHNIKLNDPEDSSNMSVGVDVAIDTIKRLITIQSKLNISESKIYIIILSVFKFNSIILIFILDEFINILWSTFSDDLLYNILNGNSHLLIPELDIIIRYLYQYKKPKDDKGEENNLNTSINLDLIKNEGFDLRKSLITCKNERLKEFCFKSIYNLLYNDNTLNEKFNGLNEKNETIENMKNKNNSSFMKDYCYGILTIIDKTGI